LKQEDGKPKPKNTLTGPEKAAILLALVGEEIASTLAAELQEKELVMLRQGVHRMAQIEADHVDEVCSGSLPRRWERKKAARF